MALGVMGGCSSKPRELPCHGPVGLHLQDLQRQKAKRASPGISFLVIGTVDFHPTEFTDAEKHRGPWELPLTWLSFWFACWWLLV